MKVAIPHWQGRVSPVFDVAGNVLIVEVGARGMGQRRNIVFADDDPHLRAAFLAATGADVLICGAISWPLEEAICATGIEVIPQTCGDIEQVLTAFTDGRLTPSGFLMPGCCGRRRRFRGRRGRDRRHRRLQ